MSQDCTVLIAPIDLLATLKERVGEQDGELLTFPVTDALRALAVITERRPNVVALERLYAATSRGAALINRIKADPTLAGSEIRIIAHNSDYMRVSPRKPAPLVQPLDQRGTRRAPRVRIAAQARAQVDGNPAKLVDLSAVGVQLVSSPILKPGQRVRLELIDEEGVLQFSGGVVWASFEVPVDGRPQYRAGIDFIDADGPAVNAYCGRHGA